MIVTDRTRQQYETGKAGQGQMLVIGKAEQLYDQDRTEQQQVTGRTG